MRLLVGATWIIFCVAPVANAQSNAPCSSPEHRAFDFWIGDWKVTNAKGQEAGNSLVKSELNGCVVTEHWRSIGSEYEGTSLNVFDSQTKTWTQDYVDNTGLRAVMTGKKEGNRLVYSREFTGRDGKPRRTRMTFFDLDQDHVRQLVEQSTDEGKTWSTQYDLRYERVKATAS